MRRNKGLCALALLLLAAGLLVDPASCCAVGGVPALPTLSGMDCCDGPAQACSIVKQNPPSGIVGRSFIPGPAEATEALRATRPSPPSRPPSFSLDASPTTLTPETRAGSL